MATLKDLSLGNPVSVFEFVKKFVFVHDFRLLGGLAILMIGRHHWAARQNGISRAGWRADSDRAPFRFIAASKDRNLLRRWRRSARRLQ
jgi:hypothetical protein